MRRRQFQARQTQEREAAIVEPSPLQGEGLFRVEELTIEQVRKRFGETYTLEDIAEAEHKARAEGAREAITSLSEGVCPFCKKKRGRGIVMHATKCRGEHGNSGDDESTDRN